MTDVELAAIAQRMLDLLESRGVSLRNGEDWITLKVAA